MNWLKNLLGIKPTQKEFADLAMARLMLMADGKDVVFDEEKFCVFFRAEDGTIGSTYYLSNAYAEYCAARYFQRNEVLKAYFTQMQHVPESLEAALPHILPRLHERSYFEEWLLQMKTGGYPNVDPSKIDQLRMPYVTIAEHFGRGLAYDDPHFLQAINYQMCNDWKTTHDELYPQALENLAKQTPEPFQVLAPGLYKSQYNDSHDASRLLLLDRIKECNVMGRPVVMVPNRNVLLITGESDPDGVTYMLNVAEDVLKHPRPMSPIPLVLSDTTWHEWHVRPDHHERNRLDYLRATAFSDYYNSQKALLDRLHEIDNEDIFVATYQLYVKGETGEILVCASWTNGVLTLLPKVENIAFTQVQGEKAEEVSLIPWTVAQEVVGHLMQETDLYPQRFRIEGFPTEDEFERMTKLM